MKPDFWNAEVYSAFIGARTRPAQDLLSAIPTSFIPDRIYDLGCGPGNSTRLLKKRWPHAEITGIDSSTEMIMAAKAACPDMVFVHQDMTAFSPDGKVSLIVSNAALQWVGNHETLFPQLTAFLEAGGVFAVQIPNNFHCASHQEAFKILKENPHWRSLVAGLCFPALTQPLFSAVCYHSLLKASGLTNLSIWETEYYYEMPNHRSIYEWVSGTGLRPALSTMTVADQSLFADAYIDAVSKHYPIRPGGGILFPFRRLFMTGIRK